MAVHRDDLPSTVGGEQSGSLGSELLVLLEPESAERLDRLAEAVGQTAEVTARALVLKLAADPATKERFSPGSAESTSDDSVEIPTTSEIYLASFQEQARQELRLSFEAEDLRQITSLGARAKMPPGRVLEVLLTLGLETGGEHLSSSDFEEVEAPSKGFFSSLRKKIGL